MTNFPKKKNFFSLKVSNNEAPVFKRDRFFSLNKVTTLFVYGQRYLDEAEREKMQYAQELKEYQQTEAYQITSAKIQDKRIKKGNN